jgi:hypothetical protein
LDHASSALFVIQFQQVSPKFLCSIVYGIQTVRIRGNKAIMDKSWTLWTFLEAEKRFCDVGFSFEDTPD